MVHNVDFVCPQYTDWTYYANPRSRNRLASPDNEHFHTVQTSNPVHSAYNPIHHWFMKEYQGHMISILPGSQKIPQSSRKVKQSRSPKQGEQNPVHSQNKTRKTKGSGYWGPAQCTWRGNNRIKDCMVCIVDRKYLNTDVHSASNMGVAALR